METPDLGGTDTPQSRLQLTRQKQAISLSAATRQVTNHILSCLQDVSHGGPSEARCPGEDSSLSTRLISAPPAALPLVIVFFLPRPTLDPAPAPSSERGRPSVSQPHFLKTVIDDNLSGFLSFQHLTLVPSFL